MRKILIALTMGLFVMTMAAPAASAASIVYEEPKYYHEGHLDIGHYYFNENGNCHQWGDCAEYEGGISIELVDVSAWTAELRERIDSGEDDTIWYDSGQTSGSTVLTDWSICFYDASHALLDCDRGGDWDLFGPVPYDTDFFRMILHANADVGFAVSFGAL